MGITEPTFPHGSNCLEQVRFCMSGFTPAHPLLNQQSPCGQVQGCEFINSTLGFMGRNYDWFAERILASSTMPGIWWVLSICPELNFPSSTVLPHTSVCSTHTAFCSRMHRICPQSAAPYTLPQMPTTLGYRHPSLLSSNVTFSGNLSQPLRLNQIPLSCASEHSRLFFFHCHYCHCVLS